MDKNNEILKAKEIAKNIIDGKINPNAGCDEIGKICESLDYCDELLGFVLLSHEQTGHEHLGFNKENLINDIMEEAKKLIMAT